MTEGFRRTDREKRLENRRNSGNGNVRREIAVRHAALAMFRGPGLLVALIVVRVCVRVPMVVLFERLVEHHVCERDDIEAEQPKHAAERGPMSPTGPHRIGFRPSDRPVGLHTPQAS
jgi:hypothetical protein